MTEAPKLLSHNVAEAEVRNRIADLEQQLEIANRTLKRIQNSSSDDGGAGRVPPHLPASIPPERSSSGDGEFTAETGSERLPTRAPVSIPPMGKRGYLFKWQDRSIGWGGTKWDLRFVCLEGGKLSYYKSHTDESPRYVLTLRGFGVRDDGYKTNNRHSSKQKDRDTPPLHEVGAYFHVFSIYQRPDTFENDVDDSAHSDLEGIVPLLRFSTPSLAEKTQWVRLISEACAYCDSDAFVLEQARKRAEMEKQKAQRSSMVSSIPILKRNTKGTLPALYFAPGEARPLSRTPSGTKLKVKKKYRTKSGNVDAAKSNPRSSSGYPPSRPMHRSAAPSYLSAEASMQNYRGLFNLAMIILVVSNFRLILDTSRQHGFVLSSIQVPNLVHLFTLESWKETPIIAEFAFLQLFVICSFSIEWFLSRDKISDGLGITLHYVNAHGCLVTMIFVVWSFIDSPSYGGIVLIHAVITWMKLLSYALANADYRASPESTYRTTITLVEDGDPKEMTVSYPRNVTLPNIYYFWFAPTLTYQIAFPRTQRVRIWRVAGLLVRLVFAVFLSLFLTAQVIAPNLNNLVRDLEGTNGQYTASIMAEYWLRLAIVNTYEWLLMFYIYFHLYLNLLAELLRFGDRVFYKDWWNSSEVSAYWRLWNMPVHYWLIRHVYFPCIRMKMPSSAAVFLVFFLSAVMHEVLISVPFHMIRPWSFFGMMLQMPLVAITKYLYRKMPGSSIGNIVFWMCFCVVGQPMAILLYTADYQYGMQFGAPAGSGDSEVCLPRFAFSCFWR